MLEHKTRAFLLSCSQSISFDEFKVFCLFTNNLEDFAFSMKMVSEANRPVGMGNDSPPHYTAFTVYYSISDIYMYAPDSSTV